MDRYEEKIKILEAIVANRFMFRDHTVRRSDQRSLSWTNVVNAAKTIIEWKWQESKQTHLFIGFLEEGQPGGFTAVIDRAEDIVWVVTVFKRRLSRREKNSLNSNNSLKDN